MADFHANHFRSSAKKVFRWIGRAVLALTVLAFLFGCFGAIYQIVGDWRDINRFPQRGKSVQAGLVKLNLNCTGHGSLTVILDSGSGIPAVGWIKVQPEVAEFARVCSYDRAGYGWSESGPEPRTSLQIAKELKVLLDAAGEKGPYLLVGHSFGGFNIRVFTGQYPKEVAGMVLVDATSEGEEERIERTLSPEVKEQLTKEIERNERLDQILTPLQTYLGIKRLRVAIGWGASTYLSKALQQELFYLERQTKSRNAVENEGRAFSQSVAQVRSAVLPSRIIARMRLRIASTSERAFIRSARLASGPCPGITISKSHFSASSSVLVHSNILPPDL